MVTGSARRLGSAELEWIVWSGEAEWVALPGPLGEEAAVVIDRELHLVPSTVSAPVPARPLDPEEIARLPLLLARALVVAQSLSAERSGVVRAVRPTLAGGFVVELSDPRGNEQALLERLLSERLGYSVPFVVVPSDRVSYGSLGRLARGEVTIDSVVARLVRGWPERPGGYPRLGTVVATSRGKGMVQSVRTRDRTVLVQAGGEVVRFALDELGDET